MNAFNMNLNAFQTSRSVNDVSRANVIGQCHKLFTGNLKNPDILQKRPEYNNLEKIKSFTVLEKYPMFTFLCKSSLHYNKL